MYAIFTNETEVINFARSKGAQVVPVTINKTENPTTITDKENERLITTFLTKTLHIPANLSGFVYLKTLFLKCLKEDGFERNSLLSVVYKYCAIENNSSISKVERAIRHCNVVSYNQRDKEKYYEVFGTDKLLTSSAFICTAVNYFKNYIC